MKIEDIKLVAQMDQAEMRFRSWLLSLSESQMQTFVGNAADTASRENAEQAVAMIDGLTAKHYASCVMLAIGRLVASMAAESESPDEFTPSEMMLIYEAALEYLRLPESGKALSESCGKSKAETQAIMRKIERHLHT